MSVASRGKLSQCREQEEQSRWDGGSFLHKCSGGHILVRGIARQKSHSVFASSAFCRQSAIVLWSLVNISERKQLVPPLFNVKLQIEIIVCGWWENDERKLKSFLLEACAMWCGSYPHLLLNQSLRQKAGYSWMVKEEKSFLKLQCQNINFSMYHKECQIICYCSTHSSECFHR